MAAENVQNPYSNDELLRSFLAWNTVTPPPPHQQSHLPQSFPFSQSLPPILSLSSEQQPVIYHNNNSKLTREDYQKIHKRYKPQTPPGFNRKRQLNYQKDLIRRANPHLSLDTNLYSNEFLDRTRFQHEKQLNQPYCSPAKANNRQQLSSLENENNTNNENNDIISDHHQQQQQQAQQHEKKQYPSSRRMNQQLLRLSDNIGPVKRVTHQYLQEILPSYENDWQKAKDVQTRRFAKSHPVDIYRSAVNQQQQQHYENDGREMAMTDRSGVGGAPAVIHSLHVGRDYLDRYWARIGLDSLDKSKLARAKEYYAALYREYPVLQQIVDGENGEERMTQQNEESTAMTSEFRVQDGRGGGVRGEGRAKQRERQQKLLEEYFKGADESPRTHRKIDHQSKKYDPHNHPEYETQRGGAYFSDYQQKTLNMIGSLSNNEQRQNRHHYRPREENLEYVTTQRNKKKICNHLIEDSIDDGFLADVDQRSSIDENFWNKKSQNLLSKGRTAMIDKQYRMHHRDEWKRK